MSQLLQVIRVDRHPICGIAFGLREVRLDEVRDVLLRCLWNKFRPDCTDENYRSGDATDEAPTPSRRRHQRIRHERAVRSNHEAQAVDARDRRELQKRQVARERVA